MKTVGSAKLANEIPAQRAVATVVPRAEITTVLRDPEGDPELFLRIGDEDEIGMSWSRSDLEELLARSSGDEVVLTFDRDELSAALDDVEAHGMRDKALVFAVAAAGALGAGVGIANAMPSGDEGGPVVTSVASPTDSRVTDVSSAAGYVAPVSAQDSRVTDVSSAAGYVAPVSAQDSRVTDASSSAAGKAASLAANELTSTPAISVASASDNIISDAASGSGYTAPVSAQDSRVTDVSSSAGYTVASEGSAADTLRTDASSSGGYGPAPSSDSSGSLFSVHAPSTTDGLLAGGILLAITGATFVSRRRPGTARPA